jgi:acetoin utilization deacetylase AcuC-like enzyme
MSRTGFYTHPDCQRHDMGRGHPECPERLSAIRDRLLVSGVDQGLIECEAPMAQEEDILLAHDPRLVEAVTALNRAVQNEAAQGGRALMHIDPDTAMCEHSYNAAMRAVGAALAATDAVLSGELDHAFCAIRPPGHHATRARSMGFCIFNSLAIAVMHALERHGLERVAVIDFDVHHGNGTEDILAGDERVLMCSTFQHPFYPYCGTEDVAPNMVNVPVPAYTAGSEIRKLMEKHWFPALEAFKPQLIFISAGFDAHREDDLGQLGMTEADYRWVTEQLLQLADRHCQGRIVSCLEGGYNLSALGRSVEAHLRALAGL